ncbi:hypothetical protein BHM03_00061279 [Ensete ventricosum]|nr:hypothetical protein BHM03_00061279 [Ensete ventricosum]
MAAIGEGKSGSRGEKREARTMLMAWLGAASPRFIDETTTKEGATTAEKGAVGGFWVPRLEGSDSYCYVRRRNCYYRSLEGSDGGSQVLAVMVAAVEVEEATVVMEQRAVDGVDQRPRLEAMDVDSKEEQQRCGRQLLSMLTVRIGGTMAMTMISGCKINNNGKRGQCNVKQVEAEEATRSSSDAAICGWRGRQQQRWLWLHGLKVAYEGDESSGKKRKKMRAVAGVRRDIAAKAGEKDNGPRSAVED